MLRIFRFIGWDVVRHVRIGKFKSWPKIAVCSIGSTFFGFEKGFGSNAPSSPPRIAVIVED